MSSEESDMGWVNIAVMFVLFAVAVSMMVGVWGYIDYSMAYWGQQQCEEKYGSGAEYVGEPSAFSSIGICEANGDQHFIRVEQHGVAPVWPYLTGGAD